MATATDMNTKDKGDISEAMVQARYIELGYTVLTPFGENDRYDFVLEDPREGFIRVQVKTARSVDDNRIEVQVRSSCEYSKEDYHGDVDVITGYHPETDTIVEIPIEECGTTTKTLRFDKPERKDLVARANLVEDYEL
jgi:hypothetical protein